MNMAHGELAMLGAYLLFSTASLFVGHPLTAIATAVVMSLVVGVLVYVLLMRKMTGEMVLAAILTTVAIGILLRGLVVLIWSAAQQHPLQVLGSPIRRSSSSAAPASPPARRCIVLMTVAGLWRPVRVPALRPLGHAHAGGRAESAARGATRRQPACDLCAGLGPFDPHRIDRRHADRARFRPRSDHGGHRAQGLRAGAGRRPRQPGRRPRRRA